jgi:hypothetical protein
MPEVVLHSRNDLPQSNGGDVHERIAEGAAQVFVHVPEQRGTKMTTLTLAPTRYRVAPS